jgi:molecular chaperone GrpE
MDLSRRSWKQGGTRPGGRGTEGDDGHRPQPETPPPVPVAGVETSPPPAPDRDTTAISAFEELHERLDEMTRLLMARSGYEEAMEQSFKMLYDDLQEARPDRLLEQFRPLYLDIILLLDRVEDLLDGETSREPLRSIRDELVELLARRAVERVTTSGDDFDPTVQRAVGRRPTDDASLHGRVAQRLRQGFRFGDRIIRHEQVAVWAPPEQAGNDA